MEVPSPGGGHGREGPGARSATRSPRATPIAELGRRRRRPSRRSAGAGRRRAAGDRVDVVVIGAGPGGYTAAFRAADLGLSVVARRALRALGGVCLNVGCIPSKALLHLAKVIAEAEEAPGSASASRRSTSTACAASRTTRSTKLTGGLAGLAKRRKVDRPHGEAAFTGPNTLQVGDDDGRVRARDHRRRLAAPRRCRSSRTTTRVMHSTGALELPEVPERLLVIGGGIIGLEMATVYDALGSEVTVVELEDQLIPGCDTDLVRPLHKRIEGRYEAIHRQDSVERGRGARTTACTSATRSSTASWSPSAAAPTATTSAPTQAGVRGRRPRLHRGRRPAAHQRRPHLRDRRRRRRADARPQGDARGRGRRRGDRRPRRRLRRRAIPRRLHRPRGRLGRA